MWFIPSDGCCFNIYEYIYISFCFEFWNHTKTVINSLLSTKKTEQIFPPEFEFLRLPRFVHNFQTNWRCILILKLFFSFANEMEKTSEKMPFKWQVCLWFWLMYCCIFTQTVYAVYNLSWTLRAVTGALMFVLGICLIVVFISFAYFSLKIFFLLFSVCFVFQNCIYYLPNLHCAALKNSESVYVECCDLWMRTQIVSTQFKYKHKQWNIE